MISIVIPLYNKEASIGTAIASVMKQGYPDFEIVVVDDGSKDEGAKVVEAIQDNRIRLIRQENAGVSAARNKGIAEARCEWIAFLDADDEWKPTFLETVHRLSEKYKDCKVCACAYEHVDEEGNVRNIRLNKIRFEGTTGRMDNYFEVAAHSDPPIWSSCVMIKKSALESIGGFPVGVAQGEDLLTWARLAAKYKIAYCTEAQSIFHTEGGHAIQIPKRIPPKDDVVGKELAQMYASNPELIGLKEYVASWHKIRASIYLRLKGYGRACRKEIRESLKWNNKAKKLYAYWLLTLIPHGIRVKIISRL